MYESVILEAWIFFVNRADYWKSQDRKFCEFCKCWMADNKPSVEFHERGKRHKENVEKRLKEISKKSQKDHRAQQKMNDDIKKMEQAAMKAYMKDVHAQADYSSQFVSLPDGWTPDTEKRKTMDVPNANEVGQTSSTVSPSPSQLPQPRQPGEIRSNTDSKPKKLPASVKAALPKAKAPTMVGVFGGPAKHVKNYVHQKKLPKWYESKAEDGKTYYWNTITKATSWEKPEDGYVSLELQASLAEEEEAKKKKQQQQWEIVKNPLKVPLPASEKPEPYGKWSTIETESRDVDLQLPVVDRVELQVPTLSEELPQVKFKERTVTSLAEPGSSSEPTAFKKRKMQRFNVRQRTNDD